MVGRRTIEIVLVAVVPLADVPIPERQSVDGRDITGLRRHAQDDRHGRLGDDVLDEIVLQVIVVVFVLVAIPHESEDTAVELVVVPVGMQDVDAADRYVLRVGVVPCHLDDIAVGELPADDIFGKP